MDPIVTRHISEIERMPRLAQVALNKISETIRKLPKTELRALMIAVDGTPTDFIGAISDYQWQLNYGDEQITGETDEEFSARMLRESETPPDSIDRVCPTCGTVDKIIINSDERRQLGDLTVITAPCKLHEITSSSEEDGE